MTEAARPDPDVLLARLQDEGARALRGRLRIYFGASAGVGKTYAMLQDGHARRAAGIDVVAGVIETHGRQETAARLEGLPLLPPAWRVHRGLRLPEFDLDGALARRPALILVDELAHSNLPGSRHPKRWQDVEELLGAGIDVCGTLNVQHLESLNDVVGGITGVVVHETVPDTFFDAAAEVVLVDTTADDLIARLKAGKVYQPEQAERAAAGFFRKGNLMALRELALRRTADRVGGDVQAYRSQQLIDPVWKTEGAILCCIGADSDAGHVVRSAARLATQLAAGWHAVYVETPDLQRLPNRRREQILAHVKLARELGARTAVLPARDPAQALVSYARAHNLSKLVLGRRRKRRLPWISGIAERLAQAAPDIDQLRVGQARGDGAAGGGGSAPAAGGPPSVAARDYLLTLLVCAGTTGLAHLLAPYFDIANIVMVFLLSVVVVALWLGRGAAVLSAFVSVAAFDFFFVPPRLSFAVSDIQYLLTFTVMLSVGLVIGQLTAGLRFQARVLGHREARSRALFEAARDLSNVLTREEVLDVARRVVEREFRAAVAFHLLDAHDRLESPVPLPADLDPGTAQWCLDHQQPAGLGSDTLPGSAWLYLPLKAPMRARGVLALRPEAPRFLLIPEQREQLETFAALTAMALERIHYVQVARDATVRIESERLRNSLLAALSHDLRTPLAALAATAGMLAGSAPPLAAAQQALVDELGSKTRRLATLVGNLLEMARLQSGSVRLRREWHAVEELVAGAVQGTGDAIGPRSLDIRIEPPLLMVECDGGMIERVLVNLLENAGKYTPPTAHLRLDLAAQGPDLCGSLRDDGPGVAAGQEEAIFEKFTRGEVESSTPGVGLGLALCRAIIEAHGGRIGYEPVHPHGACFRFRIPRGVPPDAELPDDPAVDASPSQP